MKTRATAILILALLGGGALAEPPEGSPRPEARPGSVEAAASETGAGDTETAAPDLDGPEPDATEVARSTSPTAGGVAARIAEDVRGASTVGLVVAANLAAGVRRSPRPPERPENLRRKATVAAAGFRVAPLPPVTGVKGALCGDPQIQGVRLQPIVGRITGCGLDEPVQVRSVAGVALSTPATVDCVTATALRQWVETAVKPVVGRLGGGVASLQVAAHYSCRSINNQEGARISEHGKGHAIDISAITLRNGVAISVLKGWHDPHHAATLKTLHRAACGTFATVLGPNADQFHQDHFHLDTARRGGRSYCR